MATQYSYSESYSSPESEYRAEELQRRLQYSMANFAQLRFKRSMQMQIAIISEDK